jgi:hypothetical protein
MANGMNATNVAAILKTRYTPDFQETLTYPNKPLFAMMKKFTKMGGKQWEVPVFFEDIQSVSATFSTAQTQSTATYSRVKSFSVTRVEDFGLATVKGQDIESTKGDANAFIDMLTLSVDSVMRSLARSAAISLYRSGFGAIGQVSSPGGDTTLTLVNKQDITNFAVGMKIAFSASESGDALRDSGEEVTVNSVDRNAGTMVLSANETSIASIATNDYIFRAGDRQDSSTPTRLKIAGLEAWVPYTAPTSTTFFGVDRTTDTRLGGCRLDGTAMPIEEALIEGSILVQREGGDPGTAFMNPTKYGNLINSLGSKVQYCDIKAGTAGIGFRGIDLHTPAGSIQVLPDRDCPVNRIFLLDMKTWTLGSLGEIPRILSHDGLENLRQASDDGLEIRVGYYGNAYCNAPGWNCVIAV